jgi:erythronate-4-phosphate dehydrogenase
MTLRILADKHLYNIREMLPPEAKLTLYEPNAGLPDDATGYDALLIRTVTKINQETLPYPGKLSFIGTATAGVDHIDLNHLKKLGIRYAHSPGCNARAVGEYVLTGILRWSGLRDQSLVPFRVGIVGCGNTGSSVMELLTAFDIEYSAYDPPKQETDPNFVSASEEELLSCDILTLHTPLTHTGPYPTFHLLSKTWLNHPFRLIINASRGGVLDEQTLQEAMHRGTVRDCILDVWENEPVFSDEMADMAMIATPHIAGYSKEAKTTASRMIAEQLCEHFDLESPRFKGPEPQDQTLPDVPKNLSLSEFLWEINQTDLYDRKLRNLIGKPDTVKAKGFSHLRTSISTRYEYASLISAYKSLWKEKVPKDAEKLIRS